VTAAAALARSPDWEVFEGDCIDVLREIPDASVDAAISDPPYGMSEEPDIVEVLTHWLAGDRYEHGARGFMGKTWDSFVPGPEYWREVNRVLKPGGHLLAFAAPRTYDLMAIAVRFARFEVRDMIEWLYATGFPKSLNVGEGRGTALKPAHEPVILARKHFDGTVAANILAHGTGALNIDACRIEGESTRRHNTAEMGYHGGNLAESYATGSDAGRWPANLLLDEHAAAELDRQSGDRQSGDRQSGVRKGMGYHGADGDGGPAIVGSSGGASRFFFVAKPSRRERDLGLESLPTRTGGEMTDREEDSSGLKSPRAGAGRGGGRKNTHPTVKPVELMRYLCRLVTPPGGIVLDPFCGSGTTGMAAVLEGFDFMGVEREAEYVQLARLRIAAAEKGSK
jgi:DNA modification methylase